MTTTDAIVDHVVIGAGSAGSAVARRLHDGGRTVLVVEAGPLDTDERLRDPARLFELRGAGQPTDWNFVTEPQRALGGRRIVWPRGRGLGGSSAINGLIWVRGDRTDFDEWARVAPGWSYDDIEPVFRRIEDASPRADHLGAGGPVAVDRNRALTPLSEAMLAAAEAAGIPRVADHNDGRLDGIAPIDLTQRHGLRVSAWQAYGAPALGSAGFAVATNALTTGVDIRGGRAEAVTLVPAARGPIRIHGDRRILPQPGRTLRVRSRGDVVLAAGAIGSPHLLLLSGVGPAEQLSAHGIAVRVHAPDVGANLHDHPLSQVTWRARGPIPAPRHHGLELHYFASSTGDGPDTQPLFTHGAYPIEGYELPWGEVFSWLPGVVRPRSRGRLSLVSADPRTPPALDPRYLEDAADLSALRWSLQQIRDLGAAPELGDFVREELAPGPRVRSRADLDAYLRRSLETYYHPAGTARMGSDAGSVVDPALRVRGVGGLRVADASIMPVVTSGNTQAPSVLIGERAAALILEEDR